MRNKVGDAHGQGKVNFKPASRHAELAVNLAGTMAGFLFSTWEIKKEKI
ncbi:abortive infection family protein [Acinetobacter sp. CIP 51.11]|nr:abortive infection family protein [Acinetobacter sp. CIP 51.11]